MTIQRWYRRHSQQRRAGAAALGRLLAAKREVCPLAFPSHHIYQPKPELRGTGGGFVLALQQLLSLSGCHGMQLGASPAAGRENGAEFGLLLSWVLSWSEEGSPLAAHCSEPVTIGPSGGDVSSAAICVPLPLIIYPNNKERCSSCL